MVNFYTPNAGDIVLINFNPQSGREQAGKRPALVISPKAYNEKVGLALFCPITSATKGYPFEVRLPTKLKTKGVILSDHLKSLDWKARKVQFRENLPDNTLSEVVQKFLVLIPVSD